MSKLQRLLAIISLLLNEKRLSAPALAEKFSVSKRTIYRDITTLEMAGLPIISFAGQTGGFGLIPNFKMDRVLFTEDEKNLLLNALKQQKELIPVDNFLEIEIKLLNLLNEPMAVEKISLESATQHRTEIEAEIFEKIAWFREQISLNKLNEIDYIDLSGAVSSRLITPLQLKLTNGSWYLEAFCYLREAPRFFKLTRIKSYQQVNKSIDKDLSTSYQQPVNNSLPYQQIQLSFKPNQLGKLVDFFSSKEIIIHESEIIIDCTHQSPASFLPLLLMFGSNVAVLQPVGLAELHLQEIKKIYHHFTE